MATRTVDVVRPCAASREAVWELLADVSTWTEWGLFDEARLETPGPDEPQGVGARRLLRTDRARNLDEIFVYEPPHRLAWLVIKGNLPVRNLRSEVQLTEVPGGTEIWWRSSYEPRIFGTAWMLDRNIKLFLADATRRLAVRAETGAPAVDDD